MNKEEIVDQIIKSGADITYTAFETIDAVTVETKGRLHVGINSRLSEKTQKAALAHELGHIKKGGLYQIGTPPLLKQKAECLADRYACEVIASPDDVLKAMRAGYVQTWELADYFDVPCSVMSSILNTYKARSLIQCQDQS